MPIEGPAAPPVYKDVTVEHSRPLGLPPRKELVPAGEVEAAARNAMGTYLQRGKALEAKANAGPLDANESNKLRDYRQFKEDLSKSNGQGFHTETVHSSTGDFSVAKGIRINGMIEDMTAFVSELQNKPNKTDDEKAQLETTKRQLSILSKSLEPQKMHSIPELGILADQELAKMQADNLYLPSDPGDQLRLAAARVNHSQELVVPGIKIDDLDSASTTPSPAPAPSPAPTSTPATPNSATQLEAIQATAISNVRYELNLVNGTGLMNERAWLAAHQHLRDEKKDIRWFQMNKWLPRLLFKDAYLIAAKERFMKQAIENNNVFASYDLAKNAATRTVSNEAKVGQQKTFETKIRSIQARLEAQTGNLNQATGVMKQAMISEVLSQLVDQTHNNVPLEQREKNAQALLRDFAKNHLNKPGFEALKQMMGKTGDLNESLFATDMVGLAEKLNTDGHIQQAALEAIQDKIDIRLSNTLWGSYGEPKYTSVEKMVNFIKNRQAKKGTAGALGFISNPMIAGASASVGIYIGMRGVVRATYTAARTASFIGGPLVSGAFCAGRKVFELRQNLAIHQSEMSHGGTFDAGTAKTRSEYDKLMVKAATVEELIEGGTGRTGGNIDALLQRIRNGGTPEDKNDAIARIAEIEARQRASLRLKKDFISAKDSRGALERIGVGEAKAGLDVGRNYLDMKCAELRIALRGTATNLDPAVAQQIEDQAVALENTLNTEDKQRNWDRKKYIARKASGAFALGFATSGAFAFGAEELGTIGARLLGKNVVQPTLEQVMGRIGRFTGFGGNRAPDISPFSADFIDIAQSKGIEAGPNIFIEMLQKGPIELQNGTALQYDAANHVLDFVNSNGQVQPLPLYVENNGHILLAGNPQSLPTEVQYALHQNYDVTGIHESDPRLLAEQAAQKALLASAEHNPNPMDITPKGSGPFEIAIEGKQTPVKFMSTGNGNTFTVHELDNITKAEPNGSIVLNGTFDSTTRTYTIDGDPRYLEGVREQLMARGYDVPPAFHFDHQLIPNGNLQNQLVLTQDPSEIRPHAIVFDGGGKIDVSPLGAQPGQVNYITPDMGPGKALLSIKPASVGVERVDLFNPNPTDTTDAQFAGSFDTKTGTIRLDASGTDRAKVEAMLNQITKDGLIGHIEGSGATQTIVIEPTNLSASNSPLGDAWRQESWELKAAPAEPVLLAPKEGVGPVPLVTIPYIKDEKMEEVQESTPLPPIITGSGSNYYGMGSYPNSELFNSFINPDGSPCTLADILNYAGAGVANGLFPPRVSSNTSSTNLATTIGNRAEGEKILVDLRDTFIKTPHIYVSLSGAIGDVAINTAYLEGIHAYLKNLGLTKKVTIIMPSNIVDLLQPSIDKYGFDVVTEQRFKGIDKAKELVDSAGESDPLVLEFEHHTGQPILDTTSKGGMVVGDLFAASVGMYNHGRSGNERFTAFFNDLLSIPDSEKFSIKPKIELPANADALYGQLKTKYAIDPTKEQVALVVGASHKMKRYSLNKWKEVIDEIRTTKPDIELNILFKDQGGEYTKAELEAVFNSIPNVRYISEGLIEQTVLLSEQKLVLSNDTGLAHVGAVVENSRNQGPHVVSLHLPIFPPDTWITDTTRHSGILPDDTKWNGNFDAEENDESKKWINFVDPKTVVQEALKSL
ncbi:hypothetical protein HGA88_06350 [Candidatus Roizmanbacteria bacterium]|nr:hypothetical protein [Candidatus Roizmanbacteria bacterium]